MSLNFKEWFNEAKRPVSVNPDVKKWLDSADKLKQTVEKLKAALKNKKPETDKDKEKEPVKVEPFKKLDNKPNVKDEKKPDGDKEEEKDKKVAPEKKELPEKFKFIQKPTKVEKDDKKGLNNGRRPE